MSSDSVSVEDRFFNQVKRQQPLMAALRRQGFADPKPYERVLNRREWIKFEKSDWFLPRNEGRIDTTCLYFVSLRRGDFRLCVDLDPHRVHANLEEDPERLKQRLDELDRKTALLEAVRKRLLEDRPLGAQAGVNRKSLRDVHKPSTVTAVKFKLGLGPDSSARQCAQAFAQVIDRVTPVIDTLLKERAAVK